LIDFLRFYTLSKYQLFVVAVVPMGSLTLITDEIGAVEQSNYFDPWGRERKIVTAAGVKQWQFDSSQFLIANKPITTRGYTGHEHLSEVGLIHMNGRIYDGKLGRFVQADPIIQDPLRVQSLNRYSYVWNNPLNATDPSGFCTKATT
jgi:RHS repeat-associated protein